LASSVKVDSRISAIVIDDVRSRCAKRLVRTSLMRPAADAHETRARKIVPRYAAVLRSTSKV